MRKLAFVPGAHVVRPLGLPAPAHVGPCVTICHDSQSHPADSTNRLTFHDRMTSQDLHDLAGRAEALSEAMADRQSRFLADLIRICSYTGQERAAVDRTLEELRAIGCDDVWMDSAGNALGRIGRWSGSSRARCIRLPCVVVDRSTRRSGQARRACSFQELASSSSISWINAGRFGCVNESPGAGTR